MEDFKVVKRQGMVDKEGKIVIPIEYKRLRNLESGVIIAKRHNVTVQEDKPAQFKYYRHQKVYPKEDRSNYHLYTFKGRIPFSESILNYEVDDKGNIIALETEHGWNLVSVDSEKNTVNVLSSDIGAIVSVTSGHIVAEKELEGEKIFEIYSTELNSKVFEVTDASKVKVNKKGFIFTHKDTGREAFFDFSGNRILDYQWNTILCLDNYIKVMLIDKNNPERDFYGIYSYLGKKIIPCEYVTLRAVKIDSNTTEIFQVGKVLEKFHVKGLIDLSGNIILPLGHFDSITFMKGNCIVIALHGNEKKEYLCKLEYHNGILRVRKIVKADRVYEMHNNRYLFKARILSKIGVYDFMGNEIVPINYQKVEWKVGSQCINAIDMKGREVKIPAVIPDAEGNYKE